MTVTQQLLPSHDARRSAIDFGALVISLDFELHWGVRDIHTPNGSYGPNLVGERRAVTRLLALFDEFGIAATWATVGFLFASSRAELESFSPALRPSYRDPRLCPYRQPIGETEQDDPLHYAPTLIEAIRRTRLQEVGTHTFSHFFCLEPGQTKRAFAADVASAKAIAAKNGLEIRSIVFPRNQYNESYAEVLRSAGIVCYRGTQKGWIWRPGEESRTPAHRRVARTIDSLVGLGGMHLTSWDDVYDQDGLCNVRASMFLKPYSPRRRQLDHLRLQRISKCIEVAARTRRIFHLWWHPHNFGTHLDENLAFLRAVLDAFSQQRERHGMRSLSMAAVAETAAAGQRR